MKGNDHGGRVSWGRQGLLRPLVGRRAPWLALPLLALIAHSPASSGGPGFEKVGKLECWVNEGSLEKGIFSSAMTMTCCGTEGLAGHRYRVTLEATGLLFMLGREISLSVYEVQQADGGPTRAGELAGLYHGGSFALGIGVLQVEAHGYKRADGRYAVKQDADVAQGGAGFELALAGTLEMAGAPSTLGPEARECPAPRP